MKKLTHILPFAGTIPFIFCTVCLALGLDQLPILGETRQTLLVYALVIASFMAGAHWGQHINLEGKWHTYLPVLSNIISVSFWLAFVIFSGPVLMTILTLGFTILLFVDFKLASDGHISKDYFRTRAIVTMIVIAALTFAGIYI